MSQKTYRTAQGKVVDFGALVLKNETIRAVGNMSVNARGDVLNEANMVIDKKSNQIQRSSARQYNVISTQVHSNNIAARNAVNVKEEPVIDAPDVEATKEIVVAQPQVTTVSAPEVVEEKPVASGLAAAIARAKAKSNNEEV
jgi:hypothetical protein